MRLGKGQGQNFCSYKAFEFDYSNLGLSLISGRAGAGKSTIMDFACWVLFGTTSKDGAVDEVRTWGVDEQTVGTQEVFLPDGKITVTRIRGNGKQNDLYWIEEALPEKQMRGKDATETQRTLEKRLGVSSELYLTSAYFHQFSKADAFFVAKAKDRRDVFERIASLQLPMRIAEGVADDKRTSKVLLSGRQSDFDRTEGRESQLRLNLASTKSSISDWAKRLSQRVSALTAQVKDFEKDKQVKLDSILAQLEGLDKEIQEPETFQSRIDQNRSQRETLEQLRAKQAGAQSTVSRIKTDIAILQHQLDEYKDLDVEQAKADAALIVPDADFEIRIAAVEAEIAQIESIRPSLIGLQKRLAWKEAERESAIREITKLTAPGDSTCPTCLGPSDNSNKKSHCEELEQKIAKLKHEAVALDADVETVENKLAGIEVSRAKLGTIIEEQAVNAARITMAAAANTVRTTRNLLDKRVSENEIAKADLTRLDVALAALPKLIKDMEKIIVEQKANNLLIDKFNELKAAHARIAEAPNNFEAELQKEQAQVNPFSDQLVRISSELRVAELAKADQAAEIKTIEHRIVSLTQLHDFTLMARGKLLEKAVKGIEGSTNTYLEKYFEGAMRVQFSLDADKLEVEIQKSGYPCSFQQLSGGQRRMLSLSFWVSVMKAAQNKAGVQIANLFFDEALNGLDDILKVKAFGLFQELEKDYESIVLIDHCPELNNLFGNQYRVTLQGDYSEIEHVYGANAEAA